MTTKNQSYELTILRAPAKVFEDGVLGIKQGAHLSPGDYEAAIVLRPARERSRRR